MIFLQRILEKQKEMLFEVRNSTEPTTPLPEFGHLDQANILVHRISMQEKPLSAFIAPTQARSQQHSFSRYDSDFSGEWYLYIYLISLNTRWDRGWTGTSSCWKERRANQLNDKSYSNEIIFQPDKECSPLHQREPFP